MFENRTYKQKIGIYALIAVLISMAMGVVHYFQGWDPVVIVIVANIWFFCIFYILFLPIKIKKDRERREEQKKK